MNSILKLGFISTKSSGVLSRFVSKPINTNPIYGVLSRFVSKPINTNPIYRSCSFPASFDVDLELEKMKKLDAVDFYRTLSNDEIRVAFKIEYPKSPAPTVKYRTVISKHKVFKILEQVYQCPPSSDVIDIIQLLHINLGIKELPVIRVTKPDPSVGLNGMSKTSALTETKRNYEKITSDLYFKILALSNPVFDDDRFDDELYEWWNKGLDEIERAEREENGGVCVDDGVSMIDGREDYRENGVCVGEYYGERRVCDGEDYGENGFCESMKLAYSKAIDIILGKGKNGSEVDGVV